jgi:Glycosyl hydrolases family 16
MLNVGMDEVERVIKGAVSTGAAVVVIIMGPNPGAAPPADRPAPSGQVTTATVTPEPSTTPALVPAPPTTPTTLPTAPPGTGRATAAPRRTITTAPEPTTDVPTSATTPTTPTTPTTGTRSSRTRDRTRTTGHASAENPATTGPTGPADTATAGTTAATTQGWGTATRTEDFDTGVDGWQVYDGVGNDGKGRRSPAAVTVRDGVLSLTGDASGTSGGLCWGTGHRYGRWEARMRAPASDPSYHAVALLWPDTGDWPAGGEIDFMELADPARRAAEGFVHHGADNRQDRATVSADATQWHDWAVEWTASSITMYLDGRPWYRSTDAAVQPPGPMHLCLQLDWFPTGGPVQPSTMEVDWAREYALDTRARSGGKPAGATGTGATRAGPAD